MTDFLTLKVYLITFCTGPIFKKYRYMDILGPDRGKMTIYGSNFQQVNLTPNGGVSPTAKTGTISYSWLTAEDNDFRPHINNKLSLRCRPNRYKHRTSTSIFASNLKLTRLTVDRVVPHTLLVYPCLRMQQTYMHVAAVRQNRQKAKTLRTVCAAVKSFQPKLISHCLTEINLWGRYIH